jgi:hypothetical protein
MEDEEFAVEIPFEGDEGDGEEEAEGRGVDPGRVGGGGG